MLSERLCVKYGMGGSKVAQINALSLHVLVWNKATNIYILMIYVHNDSILTNTPRIYRKYNIPRQATVPTIEESV